MKKADVEGARKAAAISGTRRVEHERKTVIVGVGRGFGRGRRREAGVTVVGEGMGRKRVKCLNEREGDRKGRKKGRRELQYEEKVGEDG